MKDELLVHLNCIEINKKLQLVVKLLDALVSASSLPFCAFSCRVIFPILPQGRGISIPLPSSVLCSLFNELITGLIHEIMSNRWRLSTLFRSCICWVVNEWSFSYLHWSSIEKCQLREEDSIAEIWGTMERIYKGNPRVWAGLNTVGWNRLEHTWFPVDKKYSVGVS
jgi:hypothetical protein